MKIILPWIITILAASYLLYAIVFRMSRKEERAAPVHCTVLDAVAVQDAISSQNYRWELFVHCDYKRVGAPEPNDDRELQLFFNMRATQDPTITVGDGFLCTVRWLAYPDYPFTFNIDWLMRFSVVHPESCRGGSMRGGGQ